MLTENVLKNGSIAAGAFVAAIVSYQFTQTEVPGVDPAGNCTASYRSAYNGIVEQLDKLDFYYDKSSKDWVQYGKNNPDQIFQVVKNIDQKCEDFLFQYKGVNCGAISADTGRSMMTDADSMATSCEKYKNLLAKMGKSAEVVTAQLETFETKIFPASFESGVENLTETQSQ